MHGAFEVEFFPFIAFPYIYQLGFTFTEFPEDGLIVLMPVFEQKVIVYHYSTSKSAKYRYSRSSSYGHTLGGAVGLAMVEGGAVNQAWLDEGKWEVEIAGKTYPAIVSFRPLYDPAMEKVRA